MPDAKRILCGIGGVFAGIILVSQNGINTRLREDALPSPLVAAAVSFSIGLACILLVTMVHSPSCDVRAGATRLRAAPWYAFGGGFLGCWYVVGAILFTSRLGFAAFQLLTTLGQLATATILDWRGFFGLTRSKPSASRVAALLGLGAGAALTLEGIGSGVGGAAPPWEIALSALASLSCGCVFPLQAALNNVLTRHLGTPFRAVVVSFFVGSAVLGVCSAAALATDPMPDPGPDAFSVEAWIYTGGAAGAFVVTANVIGVPRLGAAAYVTLFVASQLCTALVFDSAGAFGFDEIAASARRVAGVLLAVFSAALFQAAPSWPQLGRRARGAAADTDAELRAVVLVQPAPHGRAPSSAKQSAEETGESEDSAPAKRAT